MPSLSNDERIERIVRWLLAHGGKLECGGKHRRIRLLTGHALTIPGTPGDRRSSLNWVSQIRRHLKQHGGVNADVPDSIGRR